MVNGNLVVVLISDREVISGSCKWAFVSYGENFVEVDGLNKPRRIRIYKLSAYDTFTEEERALNEAYKKAGIKE